MQMSPATRKQIVKWLSEVLEPGEVRKAKIIRNKDGQLEVVSPL